MALAGLELCRPGWPKLTEIQLPVPGSKGLCHLVQLCVYVYVIMDKGSTVHMSKSWNF